MDRHIAALDSVDDRDLRLCLAHGVAYQADQTSLVAYDGAYFDKCSSYEGQPIADAINAGRVDLVRRCYGAGPMVDVGIGSGQFIRNRPLTWGHDVNRAGEAWLRERGVWTPTIAGFGAASFWDVIEHVPDPGCYLDQLAVGDCLFASLPILRDLERIRESKHYRPGEHLYYWTEWGFVAWMDRHGFRHIETTDFETKAGRDSILSFAFRRYRSDL